MNDLFAQALGLQTPWFIQSVAFDAENKRLDTRVDFQRGSRFHFSDSDAGADGDYPAYDTIEKTWRHLNFFEHECYLHAFVPRLDTPVGKRLISPPWSGRVPGFTLLFEALLVQLSTHMPMHVVSRLTNVSDYKLWLLLECYVTSAREHLHCSEVTDIGVDETSLKRGHNLRLVVNYYTSLGSSHGLIAGLAGECQEYAVVSQRMLQMASHQPSAESTWTIPMPVNRPQDLLGRHPGC